MEKVYDVIVAGGGFAGSAAALAAARKGCSVLLVEKEGCLGGAPCNCLVNPFMGYRIRVNGERKAISDGIFSEILKRLEERDGLHKNQITFSEEILKLVLDDLMEEAGVEVLFHTAVTEVTREEGRITGIVAMGKTCRLTFAARIFIDATGDGDLAVMAGCRYQLGRQEDHLCQPMTLCFRIAGVDMEAARSLKPEINRLYQQFQREGRIRNPREDVLTFDYMADGVMHMNSTRIVKKNPTDVYDLSWAEREARRQAYELYRFLKENFEPFRKSVLLSSALSIGVRESRMILGEYVLDQEEMKACTKFEDGIAACNYDIDIHNPEGSGTSHYYFKEGEYYTIPYRCLIAKDADNLLVAGRCISSTHEAQASYRIMPVCCTLGQAAGTAAALAVRDKISIREVDTDELRETLRGDGAFL